MSDTRLSIPVYDEKNDQDPQLPRTHPLRPGMYIGRLGDGSNPDDASTFCSRMIDNSIDEFIMGFGKKIEIAIEEGIISVRDYGRGIPLGKVIECVSVINTGPSTTTMCSSFRWGSTAWAPRR